MNKPVNIHRLNIPLQTEKEGCFGQLAFGYKVSDRLWKVKTYYNKVFTIADDMLNANFGKVANFIPNF